MALFQRAKDRDSELQEMAQQVRTLQAVRDLFATVSRLQDYNSVLRKIVEKTIEFVRAEEGAIRILKDEDTSTTTTIVREIADPSTRRDYKIGNSVVGWILKNKEPLLVKDLTTDERFRTTAEDQGGLTSFMATPLIYRDQIIGVLSASHHGEVEPFSDSDLQLIAAIGNQAAEIVENARLKEVEEEQLRIKSELKGAQQMQQSMLPDSVPALEEVDVYAKLIPAIEVSGDYYDFVKLANGNLGIAVGDIAGKGIPAALLMANLQANFRTQVKIKNSIPQMMTELNQSIFESTDQAAYATFFYAELNNRTMSIEYSNAGHWHPLIIRKDGELVRLDKGGLSLGMLPECTYEQDTVRLLSGDAVILYSDGITEAEAKSGEQWEEERLIETIRSTREQSAAEMAALILERIEAFTEGTPQGDDMTLIILKVH